MGRCLVNEHIGHGQAVVFHVIVMGLVRPADELSKGNKPLVWDCKKIHVANDLDPLGDKTASFWTPDQFTVIAAEDGDKVIRGRKGLSTAEGGATVRYVTDDLTIACCIPFLALDVLPPIFGAVDCHGDRMSYGTAGHG